MTTHHFAALLTALFVVLPAAYAGEPPARVVHVVMVWLKEPDNPVHRARLVEVTRAFGDMEGVEKIRIGPPVASDRPVVDDSFDIGITMVFSSRAALDAYLADPVHKAAQRDVLRPLASRVVVYDFVEDRGVTATGRTGSARKRHGY